MPEKTNIQIDFSGGTDQRTDARHVVPGKLTSLVNGTFEKTGSIRGRRGFTSLSKGTFTGGALSRLVRLGTFGMDLVASDGDGLYSYSPIANKWSYKDQLPQASATRQPIAHGATSFFSPDVAYGNGYLVFAWLENYDSSTGYGDVKATVVEVATGAQVLAGVGISSGQTALYPRVVVCGVVAHVIYGNSSGQLRTRTVSLVSPTAFTPVQNIATDMLATAFATYAAEAMSSSKFAVIYRNNGTGAAAKLNVKTVDSVTLAATSRTLAEVADPTNYALSIK